MRYAIFSDVHANRQAWEAVLADALQQGTDTLVCLGDVVGYGPKPLEVLTAVREVTPNFVLGNHDAAACGRLDPSIFNDRARIVIEWTREQLDEEALQFLAGVPLQMDGSEIQFVHAEVMEPGEFGYVDGVGPAELNLKAMTRQLGFLGHTHLPLAFTMPRKGGQVMQMPPIDFDVERGMRYLVNVGSVGEPRSTDVRASYVVYDDEEMRVYFRKVAFDVDAYKADLAASGLDICPYFVQVVDAGKVAGAPEPTVAPQMALAQLPKVAEVVAGAHGRLVVTSPTQGIVMPPGVGGLGVPVAQPKTISGGVLGAVAALVLGLIGLGVMFALNAGKREEPGPSAVNPNAGSERAQSKSKIRRAPRTPDPGRTLIGAEDEETGPLKGLEVRHFANSFQSLADLRSADEKDEHNGEEKVVAGMLNLERGGEGDFGLVWEGRLIVPEAGEYEFTLDAAAGAALFLYEDLVLETESSQLGDPKSKKLPLGNVHVLFRVEYFYHGGAKGLELTWSGVGIEGVQSLVSDGKGTAVSIAQKDPSDPDSRPSPAPSKPPKPEDVPKEVEKRSAPELISQDLLAYWSLDSRAQKESRFKQAGDGSVTEMLVQVKDQPVRYLVPSADPGPGWKKQNFNASAWEEGMNGVGYEEKPGDFDDLIATRIVSQKGMHPHSVYVRIPFEVKDPKDYSGLTLYMRYDDGFVAYLNGSLMASRHAPDDLKWNSPSTKKRSDRDVIKRSRINVKSRLRFLKAGMNMLAIQVLNDSQGPPNDSNNGSRSTDLLIVPELVAKLNDNELPDEAKPRWYSPADRPIAKETIKGKVKEGPGKFGEGFDFTEGSIEIGKKTDYTIADRSFTVSLWFTRNPNSADNQARRLISAGAGSDKKAGWALWVMQDAEGLSFAVGDGVTRTILTAEHGSLANGEWHHVLATVDREREKMSLFIDGELMDHHRASVLKTKTIGASSGLSLGKNSDDRQEHRGKLDEIALWRRALLPEEVEKIYEAGQSLGEVFEAERK